MNGTNSTNGNLEMKDPRPTMKGTSVIIRNFQKMDNITRIFYGSHYKTEKEDELHFFALYDELLSNLKTILNKLHYSDPQYKVNLQYLLLVFKMMAYTRDQELGKGECRISYIMIFLWYKHYPLFALWALRAFVGHTICGQYVRYGCWKDIKRICQYTLDMTGNENHSLIYMCIDIMLQQFKKDTNILLGVDDGSGKDVGRKNAKKFKQISLVAKWMPREKSAYGWLYEKIVFEWALKYTPFLKYVDLNRPNSASYLKAMNKARMIFRYLLTDLNQILCVIETALCNGNWNNIHLNMVNTRSLLMYKDAFLRKGETEDLPEFHNKVMDFFKHGIHNNISICKKDNVLYNYICGKYRQSWIHHSKKCVNMKMETEKTSSKIHNISFSYFVKKAFDLMDKIERDKSKSFECNSEEWGNHGVSSWTKTDEIRNSGVFSFSDEIELLNKQWKQYLQNFYPISEYIFPIIDIRNIRDETNMDYLYDAVGIACLILHHPNRETEDNIFNMKRIVAIKYGNPEWIDIPKNGDFFETVSYLRKYMSGSTEYEKIGHLNIFDAINMLINSISNTKMSLKNMEKMVIVIINDWNIDKLHEYRIHRKIKCAFENYSIHKRKSEMKEIREKSISEFGIGENMELDTELSLQNIHFYMPHIVYWNVSCKNNCVLPANCRTKRVTLFSGCNPSIMHHLSYIGLKSIREMTPYQTICNLLSSSRYDIMDTIFYEVFEKNSNMKIVINIDNGENQICNLSETIM